MADHSSHCITNPPTPTHPDVFAPGLIRYSFVSSDDDTGNPPRGFPSRQATSQPPTTTPNKVVVVERGSRVDGDGELTNNSWLVTIASRFKHTRNLIKQCKSALKERERERERPLSTKNKTNSLHTCILHATPRATFSLYGLK